jgi:hypothetical protein
VLAAFAGMVLLAAYVPFGVLHFALKGHKVWLESSSSSDTSNFQPIAQPSVSARTSSVSAADAQKALRSRASLGDIPAAVYWAAAQEQNSRNRHGCQNQQAQILLAGCRAFDITRQSFQLWRSIASSAAPAQLLQASGLLRVQCTCSALHAA